MPKKKKKKKKKNKATNKLHTFHTTKPKQLLDKVFEFIC